MVFTAARLWGRAQRRPIPAGCRFHPRCPLADAGCRAADPALDPWGGQLVACLKA